ncbi:MAG: DUF4010 domain-containing protein [Flavobacteriales bacterium]
MENLDLLEGGYQSLLARLVISAGIGLLVGTEREYSHRVVEKEESFAGVRTYTFIALFGFLAAFLGERTGAGTFIAALLGLIAMVIVSYARTAHSGSFGITSELSAVITFLLGALVFQGHILFAVILTVIITGLLSLKFKLHRVIATLTAQDIRTIIQFVIISALVLPFLPEEQFGPGDVWNLRDIWTMVILVTGISLAGYLLSKVVGAHKGTLLTGVLGGLVSSTATTLSFSRQARANVGAPQVLAAVSVIAATATLYPRILLEAWAVDPTLGMQLLVPVIFITLVGFGTAYLVHRHTGTTKVKEVPLTNPLNFTIALQFAVLYMVVQWLMSLAADRFHEEGLYAVGLVFGATDMDAITLSIARADLAPGSLQGVTALLLATLSNTVMKYLIVVFFGERTLRKYVGIGFAAIFLATVIAIALRWLW